jgi:hypothetical protein
VTRHVAVIGAGRRVRHNFLPALRAMGEHWQVVGITSRRGRSAMDVGARYGIPAAPDLAGLDWGRVDTILVSVTTSAMPTVLAQLMPHAATRDLIVDTPVFARANHLRHAGRLRAFRRVVVAEDFMRFPQHDVLRAAIAAGVIGSTRHVALLRTGSLYHGLALGRSFFGFAPVRCWRAQRVDGARHVRYGLAGGGAITVLGPYEPDRGAVIVEGDAGVVRVDGTPADAPGSAAVERIGVNGRVLGFRLATPAGDFMLEPDVLTRLQAMELEDSREFNLAKTCGTAAALSQLDTDRPAYGAADALHDTVVSALAAKAPIGFGLVQTAARTGWRALGRAGAPDIANPDVVASSGAVGVGP